MASSPITSWQIDGEIMETVIDFIFLGSKITADGHCSHEIKGCLLLGRKAMTKLDSVLINRDITSKGPYSQIYGFSRSHVQIWELGHKEGWVSKNWCLWTVVLEKTLESPLDCKDIKLVSPKGNKLWIFIGRTDAEAEAPILWPPNVKSWFIKKRPWCWERLKAGGEGHDRRRDGWMASLTQWTWIWANSRRWWRTGKPVVLQSIGSQIVGHDLPTEQPYQLKD